MLTFRRSALIAKKENKTADYSTDNWQCFYRAEKELTEKCSIGLETWDWIAK